MGGWSVAGGGRGAELSAGVAGGGGMMICRGVEVAARKRWWRAMVEVNLVTPKTKTPGGAAVKGAGEGVAVKSSGVVVDGYEQPKLLNCALNSGMNFKLDPTSRRAEARLPGSAPVNCGETVEATSGRAEARPPGSGPGRWLCK